MEQSNNGFHIAEEDLRLRGPGDLIGVQQAGFLDFKFANLLRDVETLDAARRAAIALVQKDPELQKPAHSAIKSKMERQTMQAAELLKTS
jgi:ATP-dependent DNA helicase RecG